MAITEKVHTFQRKTTALYYWPVNWSDMIPHCKACDTPLEYYELHWYEDRHMWEDLCAGCLNIVFTKDFIDDLDFYTGDGEDIIEGGDPIYWTGDPDDLPFVWEEEAIHIPGG